MGPPSLFSLPDVSLLVLSALVPSSVMLSLLVFSLLVIPAQAGIHLLRPVVEVRSFDSPFGQATYFQEPKLPRSSAARVTFWHCPKSNQKG
jgi:hypothetical protein